MLSGGRIAAGVLFSDPPDPNCGYAWPMFVQGQQFAGLPGDAFLGAEGKVTA